MSVSRKGEDADFRMVTENKYQLIANSRNSVSKATYILILVQFMVQVLVLSQNSSLFPHYSILSLLITGAAIALSKMGKSSDTSQLAIATTLCYSGSASSLVFLFLCDQKPFEISGLILTVIAFVILSMMIQKLTSLLQKK